MNAITVQFALSWNQWSAVSIA